MKAACVFDSLVESKMAEETVGAANKLSDLERYQDLSQQNV